MNDNNIVVSVCCITYNHEKFIKECLEGFVMQQTNFNFEILIHDDASTDKTANIIKEYEAKYPEIIKPIYQKENQYSKGESLSAKYNFPRAKGKYIAMCEGDDYWTDPLKLQKQVDFLEENEEYNICFHKVQLFIQEENKLGEDTITRKVSDTTNIEDLASGNFIHTPSVMLRNNFTIPKWFSKSPIGDWTLYMIAIKDKKIKKLEDVMAVYRINNKSVWSGKSREVRILNTITSFELLIQSNQINSKIRAILETKILDYKQKLPKKKNILRRLFKRAKRFFNA